MFCKVVISYYVMLVPFAADIVTLCIVQVLGAQDQKNTCTCYACSCQMCAKWYSSVSRLRSCPVAIFDGYLHGYYMWYIHAT